MNNLHSSRSQLATVDARTFGLEQHVAQDRQAIVAEVDPAVGDEARHAEHAGRQGLRYGRLECGRGLPIVECRLEGLRIEPDRTRDPNAGRVVEGRGASDENRLEQTVAECLDRAQPGRGRTGQREAPGSQRTSSGSR